MTESLLKLIIFHRYFLILHAGLADPGKRAAAQAKLHGLDRQILESLRPWVLLWPQFSRRRRLALRFMMAWMTRLLAVVFFWNHSRTLHDHGTTSWVFAYECGAGLNALMIQLNHLQPAGAESAHYPSPTR